MSRPSRRQALRARVAAYRRYATVLSDQLAALDHGDFDAFHRLSAERDEVADGIDAGPPAEDAATDAGEADPEVERLLSEAWALLRGCAETDRVVRGRLQALRDETRNALRELGGRANGARRYLTGAPSSPASHFDVRL